MELYISDLDGTLLNSKEAVSEETASTINKLIDKGLNFSIATARSIHSVSEIIEPLNLKLPIVLNNGVYVYDPVDKKYIVSNFINRQVARDILKECEKFKVEPFLTTRNEEKGDKVYYKGVYNYGQEYFINDKKKHNDKRLELVEEFPDTEENKVISIIIVGEKEELTPIYEEINKNYEVAIHFTKDIYSKAYWVEITNKGSSKKAGIQFIKKYLKVNKVICFGDNLNDSSMFEISDEKYAVSNAHEELKSMATKVIGSNDEHAVAKFIEKNWHLNQNSCK